MKYASAFFLLASFVTLAAGCSGTPTACTDVGCESGVNISLRGFVASDPSVFPLAIETCLGQSCFTATVSLGKDSTLSCMADPGSADVICVAMSPGEFDIGLPLAVSSQVAGAVETVKATVKDSMGATVFTGQQILTVQKFQPNGPDCDPTCFQASADFMNQ